MTQRNNGRRVIISSLTVCENYPGADALRTLCFSVKCVKKKGNQRLSRERRRPGLLRDDFPKLHCVYHVHVWVAYVKRQQQNKREAMASNTEVWRGDFFKILFSHMGYEVS